MFAILGHLPLMYLLELVLSMWFCWLPTTNIYPEKNKDQNKILVSCRTQSCFTVCSFQVEMDAGFNNENMMQQAQHIWSMLDDMAENDPKAYRRFIEKQKAEQKEYMSPPEPHMCVRTQMIVSGHFIFSLKQYSKIYQTLTLSSQNFRNGIAPLWIWMPPLLQIAVAVKDWILNGKQCNVAVSSIYTVCTPLGQQTPEGSPSRTWQAGGGSFSFCYLGDMLSEAGNCELQSQHVWKSPARSSRSCHQFSVPTTFLSRHVVLCTALVCRVQCSMPARLGHWQSQISNVCSRMTGQWSDRSAMSRHKTLSPSGPLSYLRSLALRIWTLSWRREGSAGITCGMLQRCSQDSLWHTGWWKAWAWEAQDDMEPADRGITESGSSQLLALMIDT